MTALVLVSCATAPVPETLPEPEAVDWVAASAPADELEVRAVEVDGFRGGEIAAMVPASVDRVVEVLSDYEHADGRRAWAKRHEFVSRDRTRFVARWHLKGKLGIAPSFDLAFELRRAGEVSVLSFSQVEAVFGVAAFFGDHSVRSRPGDPDRSLLISRVFIDSGLPFVGASDGEIAEGLREDVRLIREWLREVPRVQSESERKSRETPTSTR